MPDDVWPGASGSTLGFSEPVSAAAPDQRPNAASMQAQRGALPLDLRLPSVAMDDATRALCVRLGALATLRREEAELGRVRARVMADTLVEDHLPGYHPPAVPPDHPDILAATRTRNAVATSLAKSLYGIEPGTAFEAKQAEDVHRLAVLLERDFAAVELAYDGNRRALVDSLLAPYENPTLCADLAVAAGAMLACHGKVPFGFRYREEEFDVRGAPVQLGERAEVAVEFDIYRAAQQWSPEWLPDADLTSFLGAPTTEDSLRRALYTTHPVFAALVLPRFTPGRLGMALYGKKGESTASAGKRLAGTIRNLLLPMIEEVRLPLATVRQSSPAFTAAQFLFALSAERIAVAAGVDGLDWALDKAQAELRPPLFTQWDKFSIVVSVGLIALTVATWGTASPLLLAAVAATDLAVGIGDAMQAVNDWRETARLADALEVDALWEQLDPRLNAIEDVDSPGMALVWAVLAVLLVIPAERGFVDAVKKLPPLPSRGLRSRRGSVTFPFPLTGERPHAIVDPRTGVPTATPEAAVARVGRIAAEGVQGLTETSDFAAFFDGEIARIGLNGITGKRVAAVVESFDISPVTPNPGESLNGFLVRFGTEADRRAVAARINTELIDGVASAALVRQYGAQTMERVRTVAAADELSKVGADVLGPLEKNNLAAQRGLDALIENPPLTGERAYAMMQKVLGGALPPSSLVGQFDGSYTFQSASMAKRYNVKVGTRLSFTSELWQITDPASPFLNTVVVRLRLKRAEFIDAGLAQWMELIVARYELGNGTRAWNYADDGLQSVTTAAENAHPRRDPDGFFAAAYEDGGLPAELHKAVDETLPIAERGMATPDNQMLLPGALNGALMQMDNPQLRYARTSGAGPVWVSWVQVQFE